jgi:alkylhydroperoxidase family enzyme
MNMKNNRRFATLAVLICFSLSPMLAAAATDAGNISTISLSDLQDQARKRINATARVSLASDSSEAFKGIESLEPAGSGHIPNYLRAMAPMPGVPAAFAHVMKTLLYGGDIEPETKLGMGLRMAQMHGSPYVVAHMERYLRTTDRGREILTAVQSGNFEPLQPADRLALQYAEGLTRGVHGVSDSEFARVRGSYNDSQIVEMTMTVCIFNYLDRFVEALNLPVEAWVLDSPLRWRDEGHQRTPRCNEGYEESFQWLGSRLREFDAGAHALSRFSQRLDELRNHFPAIVGDQPRNPASGFVCGFAGQRMPLLHAASGTRPAQARRLHEQANGDEKG